MHKKPELKLFFILFICTAFIFSFSHFGVSAYNKVRSNTGGFAAGTMIGPIDVSGKSKDEAIALLTESLKNWRSDTTIHLQYKEKTIPLDLTGFHFDLENSVEMAKEGQQNEVVVTYKSGDLYQYLQNLSSELDQSTVKIDPLLSELIGYGAIFQTGEHYLKVEKHLNVALNEHDAIGGASIAPESIPIELGLLVKELSPIKVEAKSQVSLLKLLEQRQFTTFPADASTMIASVIYETIMASNFNIVEKHTSQILPEYVELGLEAKVDNDNHLDFIFFNPNESNYEIVLQLEGNTLTAYLKGSTFLNHYVLKLADKKEYKTKTIVQYSPLLSPGEVKLEQPGSNGVMIKVYRQTYGEKDEWLRDELVSEDYYPPVHRIEIHGLKSTSSTDGTGEKTGTGTDQGTVTPGDGSADEQTPSSPTTPTDPSGTENDNLYGKPNETTK